jgi:hypothetical protein
MNETYTDISKLEPMLLPKGSKLMEAARSDGSLPPTPACEKPMYGQTESGKATFEDESFYFPAVCRDCVDEQTTV